MTPHPSDRLTPREHEALVLVARGKSNVQISAVMHICQRTVENHLTHAFEKLGAENRIEATLLAGITEVKG